MKTTELILVTPRGTFKIHTIFDTDQEAKEAGWGLWFSHEKYDIYSRENRIGAVVERNL